MHVDLLLGDLPRRCGGFGCAGGHVLVLRGELWLCRCAIRRLRMLVAMVALVLLVVVVAAAAAAAVRGRGQWVRCCAADVDYLD